MYAVYDAQERLMAVTKQGWQALAIAEVSAHYRYCKIEKSDEAAVLKEMVSQCEEP
jgi:hypothetical protein